MFSPAFVLVLLAELNSIHIKTFPPALVPVGRSKMSKPPSYTFNELLKKKKKYSGDFSTAWVVIDDHYGIPNRAL